MTDLQRDIGGLEARIDGLEVRLDKQDEQMADGFRTVHAKLDTLMAAENQRKGAKATWGKIAVVSTALAGIAEGVKALFGK